jgi:hypothetical protein
MNENISGHYVLTHPTIWHSSLQLLSQISTYLLSENKKKVLFLGSEEQEWKPKCILGYTPSKDCRGYVCKDGFHPQAPRNKWVQEQTPSGAYRGQVCAGTACHHRLQGRKLPHYLQLQLLPKFLSSLCLLPHMTFWVWVLCFSVVSNFSWSLS